MQGIKTKGVLIVALIDDLRKVALAILYTTGPPKSLSDLSLTLRMNVFYPTVNLSMVRKIMTSLEKEGLCTKEYKESETFWSLTKAGLNAAQGLPYSVSRRRLKSPRDAWVNMREASATIFVGQDQLRRRTLTGVPGLDELLGGGVPSGNVVLIRGPPGSGKSILSAQFLHSGIEAYANSGIFVSFDVRRTAFLRQMKRFGYDFESHEETHFSFIDAAPLRLVGTNPRIERDDIGRAKLISMNLMDDISAKVIELKATRLVIDPITSLSMIYDDTLERRLEILRLFEKLSALGITSIVTAESANLGEQRRIEPEEYVSDGVITLGTIRLGKTMERVMQVEKMRETPVDRQPRPYRITERGIEVYPKETAL